MKIGVDAHVLSGKFQGSRTYLANLYKAILPRDTNNEYFFFGHWDGASPFGTDVNYVEYPSHSRLKRLLYQTPPLVRKYGIELFHSTYISPLYLPCKSLLTVHDILFETHPQFFNRSEVIRNKLLVRRSVRHAAQIHTVSEYSRQSLSTLYRIPEQRIKVVANGVDQSIYSPKGKDAAIERVAKQFNVRDYILCVGRLEPRKNHSGLIKAYIHLKQSNVGIGPLVIVGQRDFSYDTIFEMLRENGLEDSVRVLESVSDQLLPDLYRAARVFVYPSFAEGFGIPPLEAMACGTPVVTSNTTALGEVVGNAGLTVNPFKHEEIADAISAILFDPALASNLVTEGLRQAQRWSWDNAACSYLDAINSL